MAAEQLSSDERIWSAIRLESTDRVPVVPTLLPEPAAGLTGLSMAGVGRDNQTAVEAVFRVFDAYGGWDNPYPAAYLPVQLQAMGTHPMKMRIPGKDLPDEDPFQMVEEEILQPADYDKICEMGFDAFYTQDYLWRISDLEPERLPGTLEALVAGFGQFDAECGRRGLRPFFLASGLHPFFQLSLMRSLEAFTEDLYYDPEPVERALRKLTDELIAKQLPIARGSGVRLWLLTEERAGGYFYPPAIFERFWWPYTREIVDAFWSEGIATLFHLDQCWDLNLPYFRQLPRGSAVLELDSATDIFTAKQVLGDHLCLHGDVSASLLSIGEPEDVAGYTRKLIDEVGRGGGFILGSGCSVPPNVRPENFRAMLETARSHPPPSR
jgi:uroporphyrinogen-III decarboxylase